MFNWKVEERRNWFYIVVLGYAVDLQRSGAFLSSITSSSSEISSINLGEYRPPSVSSSGIWSSITFDFMNLSAFRSANWINSLHSLLSEICLDSSTNSYGSYSKDRSWVSGTRRTLTCGVNLKGYLMFNYRASKRNFYHNKLQFKLASSLVYFKTVLKTLHSNRTIFWYACLNAKTFPITFLDVCTNQLEIVSQRLVQRLEFIKSFFLLCEWFELQFVTREVKQTYT